MTWSRRQPIYWALSRVPPNLPSVLRRLKLGDLGGDLTEDFRATVEAPRTEMGELTTKVNLLVRAVGTTPAATTEVAKVRIPEPRAYGGARDAKELENFLFDMEL